MLKEIGVKEALEMPDEVVFADEPPIETDDTAPETVSEETLREMGVDLTK